MYSYPLRTDVSTALNLPMPTITTTSFSLETWFKINSDPGDFYLFDKDTVISLSSISDSLVLDYGTTSITIGATSTILNTWKHISITASSTPDCLSIVYNVGAPLSTCTLVTFTTFPYIVLGAKESTGLYIADAQLREMRLWGYTPPIADITQRYHLYETSCINS